MSNTDPKVPEARNVTEYKRDTLTGNLRQNELHTTMIKKATQILTIDQNVALSIGTAGWTPSGTAPLRLTHLRLAGANVERLDFVLADRNGTFDIIGVGTFYGNKESRAIYDKFASPEEPLYVVEGTFNIYNAAGSIGAGSIEIAWAGVRSPPTP